MTKKLDYKKTLNETKEKLTMGKNPFENKNKNKVLSDDEIKQLLDAISSKEPKEEKDVDTIFDKVAQSWSRFDCLKNEGMINFCMEWKLAKRLSQLLRNEVIEKEESELLMD